MNAPVPPNSFPDPVERFVARWQGHEGGQERANYALFLTELCTALDLPQPDVAQASHDFNDYVFERSVRRHRDEGDSVGRIDLYKRNSFVLEAKQSRWKGEKKEVAGVASQNDLFAAGESETRGKHGARRAWDVLMQAAQSPKLSAAGWRPRPKRQRLRARSACRSSHRRAHGQQPKMSTRLQVPPQSVQ